MKRDLFENPTPCFFCETEVRKEDNYQVVYDPKLSHEENVCVCDQCFTAQYFPEQCSKE